MFRIARWFVLLVALVLLAPACAPAAIAAQPTSTPVATIAPTITPDAAQPLVLVLPGSSEQRTMIAVNRHYSDVVKRKGWNVDLYTVQQKTTDEEEDSYIQYIAKQLASGAARADGYFGWFSSSLRKETSKPLEEAKAQGLLVDCAATAPQVVPDYWAKFQDQIVKSPYGLPLCLNFDVGSDGFALALRNDLRSLVQRDPTDFADICALLGTLKQANTENGYLKAMYRQWMDAWAMQQGYMVLFRYSGIYARMDDPDAKPVLLENILGYAAFLKDTIALLHAGQLVFTFDMDPVGKAPAMVLDDAGMFTSPYVQQNCADYVAYPLSPNQPYSSNLYFAHFALSREKYNMELVIPSRSRRAADAMALVQWVYASRDNTECLMYGQLGVDFTLQEDRISFGSELTQRLEYQDGRYWPGESVFGVAAQSRIPVDAPENTESLRTAWPPQHFAAPWLGHLYDEDLSNVMSNVYTNDKRQEKISNLENMMQNEPLDNSFHVDDWLMALKQATPDDYLEHYVDLLRKAQSREP